jgi:hypothetical protein
VSLVLENITNQYYRVLGSGVDGTGFNAILGYEGCGSRLETGFPQAMI